MESAGSSHANGWTSFRRPKKLPRNVIRAGRNDAPDAIHSVDLSRSIVDFGRSVSVTALDSLPELEVLYLVMTADRHLDHAKRAIRMVEERGFAKQPSQSPAEPRAGSGERPIGGYRKFLGRPCAALFRNDFMGLYDAYSEGRLLQQGSPLGKNFTGWRIRFGAGRGRKRCGCGTKTRRAAAESGKRWFSFFNGHG